MNNPDQNLENENLIDNRYQKKAETAGDSFLKKYCACFFPTFWKTYFDFDQELIIDRVKSALFPFSSNLGELVHAKPDLYGPFWILVTLSFALTGLGQFAAFLEKKWGDRKHFDFRLFERAFAICFGTWILAPATLILILCVLGKRPTKSQMFESFCIYGYNYILFIPACIISIIPLEFIQFIAFGAAGALSIMALGHHFHGFLDQFTGKAKYILLGVAVLWQVFLLIIFYKVFFL